MRFQIDRCSAAGALAIAAALGGCANVDLSPSAGWFQKRYDLLGRNVGGYTYSELGEAKKQQRPVTANDLVNANGGCPPPAAPQPQPAAAPAAPAAPQPQSAAASGAPATPGAPASAAPDTASLLGGGVALGMTECDVVYRAGAPSAVQIGKDPNGDRTAVLTFNSGPRAGIYRFEAGMLMEMDRVAEPSPPVETAKKKPPKSKQASRD